MKIATWNVERLKHYQSLEKIIAACECVNADILVLTESDDRIRLHYQYCYHTPTLPDFLLPAYKKPLHYRASEHRVSIFTNYQVVRQLRTYDEHTALCLELDTPEGALIVYGTITGVLGNRCGSYENAIIHQSSDWKCLTADGHSLCVCDDLNCSFADNYYYTKNGRAMLRQSLQKCNMRILTELAEQTIDHIAMSDHMVQGNVQLSEWNQDLSLSDHKGICAICTPQNESCNRL